MVPSLKPFGEVVHHGHWTASVYIRDMDRNEVEMQNLPIENVQDYPRPPLVEPVLQNIRVVHIGQLVVETSDAFRVLETHHAPTYYLPMRSFQHELSEVSGTSMCEWKGIASYFDLVINNIRISRAGWTYKSPAKGFKLLSDCLALYASKLDECYVGSYRVKPQPGDFYGGWQTPNLRGTVKGARGTEFW